MDSINKNQPEENFKSLAGNEAIEKIRETVKQSSVCFFCTGIKEGKSFATRPMSVQEVDDNGNCWFLSADDSNKNAEIENDSHVQLLFKGSDYSDFLSLYGKATISKDKGLIKELWKPIIKAWFTGGEDDPRITVIKVSPQEGYYWDNKNGNLVALVKTAVGAVMGKTFDDSIEGDIKI
ncbi:MAG TPA: pyridoxamine 5'-phosphate oxidase family protein [Ferruginibacter sp.]|nr:pyridoxamine 5'-phosphate oxidase family protein [Ferruginibacter sp.]HPH91112.1 pyridoxamine 5'-phosphate oxidase family protein [Ferruginibacter sp.]